MRCRLFRVCGLGSITLVCVMLPRSGLAQTTPPPDPSTVAPQPVPTPPTAGQPVRRPDSEAAASPVARGNSVLGAAAGPGVGPIFGPGYWWCSGWPYGPTTAPAWRYPGLGGGPFVTYADPDAARLGKPWPNGQCLFGPPVPTYGPAPAMCEGADLSRHWPYIVGPGLVYGWVGPFAASPRPRPLTVSVWPQAQGAVPPAGGFAPRPSGCLILSVKVPQPAAEVYVGGVRTAQTGTDRLFESPVLEAGKEFRYEVTVRWVESGATCEKKKVVTGTPGEVVRVDFTAPDVVVSGK
jgi:uncharacterized protein (TIGR03000 family)